MSCPLSEEQLTQMKAFIDLCKAVPSILHHPKLLFFKEYLVSLGGKLPDASYSTRNFPASGDSNTNTAAEEDKPEEQEEDEEDIESDVELDMEGVITDTSKADQEMGDETKEVTDDERDQSDEMRSKAMEAFAEQQYDEAIKLYTEAIKLNPQSSLIFAKRGQVFLKQNKLHAAIKDCSRALELNCDSAAGYKFRGRAYRLLGKFEEAANDLRESLKIDYDDQTNEWLNEVKPNADKIRQHNLNVQRHQGEKEHREKVKRVRKAQEARAEAAKEQPQPPGDYSYLDGLKLLQLMSIPELYSLIQDPEIYMALNDISKNPANISKYQNNPKMAAAIEIFLKNYNSQGDVNPGAPTDAKPETKPDPKGPTDDVGLD